MRLSFEGTYEECREEAKKIFNFAEAMERRAEEEKKQVDEAYTVAGKVMHEVIAEKAAEKAAEPAPDIAKGEVAPAAPKAVEAPVAEETPAVEAKRIELEDVRARMNAIREKLGVTAVKAVLKELGYGKLTEVPEDKFEALLVLCDAAEKGFAAKGA